jgi:hypothetical protein
MRMIVTGIRNGKSCVVEEKDCTPAEQAMGIVPLIDLKLDELPPRPPGKGEFVDIPVPAGMLRWYRVRFVPNETRRVHHTDTIDCHTVVAGSIELLLDDGAHRLEVGDSAMVTGVDHGWRTGSDGCAVSMIILGTPKL